MSVINTMLRDLEARGDNNRAARIPVRKPREKRKNYVVPAILSLSIAAALGYAGWQQFTARNTDVAKFAPVVVAASSKHPLPAGEGWGEGRELATSALTPAVTSALTPAPSPAGRGENYVDQAQLGASHAAEVNTASPPPAAPPPQHANWSWSNDGFSLQLAHANGLRYGVERVAADTLRITLAQSALATLDVPMPTPRWVESVRVQRDAGQQLITIKAVSRLEYEIAAQDGDDIVVSAWRDAESPAQTYAAAAVDEIPAGDDDQVAESDLKPHKVSEAVARAHQPPRVTPTALTEAQQDARIAAQAAMQIRTGETAAAIEQMQSAQRRLSAAPQSAALLVTVLMSQQHLNEAQPVLEQALQRSPGDIPLSKLKARLLATRGEPAQALAQLSELQKKNTHDTELLALCAGLAQQAKAYPVAANYYLQWSRLEPNNGATWYGLALALDAQGSAANASAAFRQALALISDARLRSYATTRIAQLATPVKGPIPMQAATPAKSDTVLSVAHESDLR